MTCSPPDKTALVRDSSSYLPLAALILAQIGTTGDNAAMNIAVADLTAAMGASLTDIQLATTVYALVAGAFMIVGGLVGVIAGWRRAMRAGLLLAIIGELIAATAPNMMLFTWGGRLFFGLGASLITPAILGLVAALYRGRQRAIAFGAVAGAAAIATVSPLALGLLMDAAGFRATFGFMAAYFVLVLGCTAVVPPSPPSAHRPRIDAAGAAAAVLGLGLFLLGISRMPTWGVLAPLPSCPFTLFGVSPAIPSALTGLLLLALLVPLERRAERSCGSALIPSSFVKTPAVRAGLLAVAAPFFFMGAQGIVITPFLQLVTGYSALKTGALSLVSGLPSFALATFLPRLFPHLSSRLIIRLGFCSLALSGAVLAASITPNDVTGLLYVGVALSGVGVGAVNSQANNAVASAVTGRDAQQSGGIQGAARNAGMALGIAVAGTSLLLAIGLGLAATPALDGLPESARTSVIEQGSSLMDADTFEHIVVSCGVDAAEVDRVASAKTVTQAAAVRLTLLMLAALMLLSLIGTHHLVETAVRPDKAPASKSLIDRAPCKR